MKLRYLVIFSMLMLILTVMSVSANENITDEIAISEDVDTLDNNVSGNTFGDIQKAVNNAKKNDVIELNGTYTGSGSPIKVDKNLVFDGGADGATLDAKGKSKIFTVSYRSYTITLKNINFINAKDTIFDDDMYYYSGGKLIISNCNFSNTAVGLYGAINCYDCIITNSNFINNTGVGYSGGAISSANMCRLTDCNFINNSAGYGGALDVRKAVIDRCNFISNSASGDGAAIFGDDITVKNSNFTANSATWGTIVSLSNLNISSSRFRNNHADKGGAICLCDARLLTVNGCEFINNTANKGGCIYSESELYNSNDQIYTNIRIYDTNITNPKNCQAIYTTFANLYLTGVNVTSSPGSNDIYVDLGEFKSVDSHYIGLKKITSHKATLSADKFTTYYDSDGEFAIVMRDDVTSARVMYAKVKARVFTGKKSKLYPISLYYDDIPVGVLYIDKKFSVGKHKVVITSGSKFYKAKQITTYIIVKKAKTTVDAPAVKAKYHKSKKFKVTIRNKITYSEIPKLKIKIKVYTGKKYKTFKVKTNKNGVASINTKSLKRGVHKVKITSLNKNYKVSKKSKITIK